MNNAEIWFNKNYIWIKYWAKKWSPQYWSDLITFYWLWLNKNWLKFSIIPDGDERKKYTQKWFRNTVSWSSSDFNKSLTINNLEDEWVIPDVCEENYYDIISESEREDIKEWLLDINKRFSENSVDKLMLLRKIYLELSTPNKVLWDLYFTQMLSMRDISKKIDLPLSSVYNMITELKKIIRKECGLK